MSLQLGRRVEMRRFQAPPRFLCRSQSNSFLSARPCPRPQCATSCLIAVAGTRVQLVTDSLRGSLLSTRSTFIAARRSSSHCRMMLSRSRCAAPRKKIGRQHDVSVWTQEADQGRTAEYGHDGPIPDSSKCDLLTSICDG